MDKTAQIKDNILAVLMGVAVGDALGVPVEFKNRPTIAKNPITDMVGHGTHGQPPGTFSDDSSLTFCLAEALTEDFDLKLIGQNFVRWYNEGYWTAHGEVFDIGMTTRRAIEWIANNVPPELAGGTEAFSNGNGSLMRISPLLFYIKDKTIEERYEIIRLVSSITHGHIRSIIACFYYLEYMRLLYEGKEKFEAYKLLQTLIPNYITAIGVEEKEVLHFDRLLKQQIADVKEDDIIGSGYVVNALEASIWCILTTNHYKDAVLKAVNLGEDTDSTAAITGGIAGLYYGIDSIPKVWISQLARHNDIEELAERLSTKFNALGVG